VRLLALDTSTRLACVAGADLGAQRIAERREEVSAHSEKLLLLIDDCLRELGLRPADLDGVICGSGPGSFTGLRIGLSTAKGLCYALGRPLAMISSLLALAQSVGPTNDAPAVLATMDAFRGRVFARLCVRNGAAVPAGLSSLLSEHPRLLSDGLWRPDELSALLHSAATPLIACCGSGVARYPELLPPDSEHVTGLFAPKPDVLVRLGAELLARGETTSLAAAVPNYLAVSAAEENPSPLPALPAYFDEKTASGLPGA
jgi:tRNA threonylcarbamoyl adenosine modification protein YeaZ